MSTPRFDLPRPDLETQPWWDAARERRLLIKRCASCGRAHFYPRPFCPHCWSDRVDWEEASGRATLVHVLDRAPQRPATVRRTRALRRRRGRPRRRSAHDDQRRGLRLRRSAHRHAAGRRLPRRDRRGDAARLPARVIRSVTCAGMAAGRDDEGFTFRWEAPVHEVFPSLHEAQSAWLGPDRVARARPIAGRASSSAWRAP